MSFEDFQRVVTTEKVRHARPKRPDAASAAAAVVGRGVNPFDLRSGAWEQPDFDYKAEDLFSTSTHDTSITDLLD